MATAVQIVLPDELIVEILSILPAKSLLRCRSVCKSWLNLMNSTKFKLMHLGNFNQLNPRYFICRFDYSTLKEWFCVHLDDEDFTFDCNLQFRFHIDRFWYAIIGCCNGVVCIYDERGDTRSSSDRLILWNPSIRRNLTLTVPIFKVNQLEDSLVIGFGYDKVSDDYKVVHIVYYDDHGLTRPHVEVYALKTGIWREVMFPVDLCCIYIHYNRSQTFMNGCMHWTASDPTLGVSHNSIMTFDISTELFGEIPLPNDLAKVELTELSTSLISVVGESLAVTYYHSLINMENVASRTYKTWVMKEYKNPTSWTLIYSMCYPDIEMGKPLKLRNKWSMIMDSTDRNIIVYNYSGSEYASCICIGFESGEVCRTFVDKYQESLVLLDVGHSVSNDEGFDDDD